MLDAWEEAQQPFSIIMADVDYFKRINDEFGHDVGDEVLKFLAKHMQAASRPDDLVCRSGGGRSSYSCCQKRMPVLPIRQQSVCVNTLPMKYIQVLVKQSLCHLGVASWPCAEATVVDVMKYADRALYSAKEDGRNRVHRSQVSCL